LEKMLKRQEKNFILSITDRRRGQVHTVWPSGLRRIAATIGNSDL